MAREKERELRELERATRTIFAFNLNLRADERDLFEFFSKVGRVVDIRLITDKNTKRSRGLAYIEFSKVEEVISAVAMTGSLLMGQPVMVKASEAEKNMAWEAAQQQKQSAQAATQQLLTSIASTSGAATVPITAAAVAAGPCWLTISNLHRDVGEAELTSLFSPFGGLGVVQVARDASGASTGVAHVQYSTLDAAAKAMAHWHGRKLVDGQLSVTAAAAPPATATPVIPNLLVAAALPVVGGVAQPPLAAPPLAVVPPVVTAAAAAAAPAAAAVVTAGELDEDEGGGGIKMSAQSRMALMSKLAGAAGLPLPPPALVTPAGLPAAAVGLPAGPAVDPALLMAQGVLGPSSPVATPCLLLKNMFEPGAPAEAAALAEEVEADVREECERFGQLLHVWVDARSKGFVYLKFAATQAAEAAHRTLHGRWYGGRQILAEYQFLQVYNSHFKLTAQQAAK